MASWRELQEEIREGLEERKSKNRGLHPKRQALMTAIRQQNLEKVDRLLNQGVDPNFRDASGNFPLHLACLPTRDEDTAVTEQIVERLVFMGADLEVQDRFSRLPLHIAAGHTHRIVKILLDKGCSINAQDNDGCTALMEACSNNATDPVDTVTLLLHYNANIHLANQEGFTALHYICKNQTQEESIRNELAVLLLQAGLSATVCDREGKIALCYELNRLNYTTYHSLPQLRLDLMETLICAGSNLRHNCKAHRYWVRFALNTVSPKVLLTVLQLFSPLVTRPALHLISKCVAELQCDGHDTKHENDILQTELSRLTHSVDTLQCICRFSIRAHLRGKVMVGVPRLPLPSKLKNFLMSRSCKPV